MKKMLLVHGWDYKNYTKFGNVNAWSNREKFIIELKKNYKLVYMNLPGFCGEKEPVEESWDLDFYADFINEYVEKVTPDFILGYSFGAAVATRWKSKYKGNQKLILVSPALLRAKTYKDVRVHYWPKEIEWLKKFLRDVYLIHIVGNPEMKHGSRFLRETYQKIVREDLSREIKDFSKEDYILIFGEKDTMVPPKLLLDSVGSGTLISNLEIINGGGHDIAKTYTKKLVKIVRGYINENNNNIRRNKKV